MIKKFRYIIMIGICILLTLNAYFLYIYFHETKNISVTNCKPGKGLLLADIDGEPYYYDPIYLFKLTDGAFSKQPDEKEKKMALFYELAYMESVSRENTVTKERLEQEIEFRKQNVEGWDNSQQELEDNLQSMQSSNDYSEDSILQQEKYVEEMSVYVQRYYELLSACTKGAGISEEAYWQEVVPYIKKGCYVALYCDERYEEYKKKAQAGELEEEEMDQGEDAPLAYMMGDFSNLIQKYNVEIIDGDLQ